MTHTNTPKITGYDSIRFLAASVVVFCHIELIKHYRGDDALVTRAVIDEAGKLAVAAFFALSGFLITLLLLKEKERTGTINLRNFYLRRGLRIWPLYYVIVLLAFFVLPLFNVFHLPLQTEQLHQHLTVKFIFSMLLMPQMLLVKYLPVPGAEQLWTIGAEEIFYFLWPLVLIKAKNKLKVAVWGISVFVVLKYFLMNFSGAFGSPITQKVLYKASLLMYYNRLDCLLLGAFAAIVFVERNSFWMKYVADSRIAIGLALFVPVLFVWGLNFGGVDYFTYSACFAWLVLYLAQKEKAVRFPRFTERMGKYSYGIYMWHFIAAFVGAAIADSFFGESGRNSLGANICLYITSYALTYFLSVFSYTLLEAPFLKLKDKFRN